MFGSRPNTPYIKINLTKILILVMIFQLVIPVFQPQFVTTARAATQAYTFSDESDYQTGQGVLIEDGAGVAQFQLNWDIADSNFGTSGVSDSDLVTIQNNNLPEPTSNLIFRTDGKLFRCTTFECDSENWVADLVTIDSIEDISGSVVGQLGPDPQYVIAVGSDGGVGVIRYSDDGGTTWQSPSIMPDFVVDGISSVDYVAFSPNTDNALAVLDDGQTISTDDGGDTWVYDDDTGLAGTVSDFSWNSNLILVGTTTGELWKSTDGGNTWDMVEGITGVAPPEITEISFSGDYVFVAGGNFLFRGTLGSDLDLPASWSNLAGNVPISGWTGIDSFYFGNGDLVLASVQQTSMGAEDGLILSSVDSGNNWAVADSVIGGSYIGMGIARLNQISTDDVTWLVRDSSGNLDSYKTNNYQDQGWVITNTPIAATEINSLGLVFPDSSDVAEVKLAFGFDDDPSGTWYYYDGADWVSGVGSDVNFSSFDSNLTAGVMQSFDDDVGIAGPIYTRIYFTDLTYSPPLVVLGELDIDYDAVIITVTSPNGGEDVAQGATHDITWTAPGISGNIVKLEYSLDNGGVWVVIDNTDTTPTANDGTYAWTVPMVVSDEALVRVSIAGTTDQSNSVFAIIDGGGSDLTNDDTPPVSTVQLLDEYTNELPLVVYIIATDYQSGIDEVSLYYTKGQPASDEGDLIQFGQTKGGCPTECFNWEFSAPSGEGKYYFYSSAVDHAGNDNFEDKFGSSNFSFEAETRVDTTGPSVISHNPTQDEEMTPTAGEISIRFDERVYGARLEYDFYTLVDGEKVSALDKLGQEKWNFDMYCEPDGSGCMYPVNDLSFRIPYSGLTNNTKYYFAITKLYDKAGNSLKGNYFDTELDKEIWLLRFTTVEILNPDLSQSKIEVTNLPDSGEFKPNDMVSFEATLRNASDLPATATIAIPVANGLAYCSVSPCSPASSNSGQAPLVTNDNGFVTITWTGTVTKGTDVLIRFDTKVKNPAYELSITQTATIDDGIHDELYHREATLQIADGGNFTTSIKTGSCYWKGTFQTCSDAVVGTQITYTVTITNTGTTASTRTVVDALGNYLQFIEGSGPTGAGWDSLTYDETSDSIIAIGTILPGVSKNFTFSAVFTTQAGGKTVTNVANISEWSPDPSFSTSVPGISKDEEFSPTIVVESPTPNQHGVALNAPIVVAFSKSIDIKTFGYSVTALGGTLIDTREWKLEWEKYNGAKNAQVSITRPEKDEWDLGATYQVQISSSTTDTNGNALAGGSLPNPWSFTAVDPKVVISMPTDPIVKVDLNKVSPELVVSIQDQFTNEEFTLSEPVKIGLLAEIPATGPGLNKRQISRTAKFAEKSNGSFKSSTETDIFHITIPAESSQSSFYFKDSVANLVSVVAFPDPWNGWSAGTKPVLVGDVELELGLPVLRVNTDNQKIKPGAFSSPINITATGSVGQPMLLPETLYFHTESTTGRWYDANFKALPDYVTVQAKNPQNKLQFAPVGGMSAVFYYKDSVAQSSLLTVSDNVPLSPDTGFINGNAIMTISDNVQPLLEEFPVVIDETGRELMEIVIDPASASLLPGGLKSFKATAKDTLGNTIDNAIFKWYVVAGGGTVEADGVAGDTHTTMFTAGQEVGTFYDTIIVGTVYNGKFGFATASVKVTDLAGYAGLPITGVSTIQMIFFILTMITAVALAWVEHYDKTHYAQKQ